MNPPTNPWSLLAFVAVVLAIIGSATYLASIGVLSAGTMGTLLTLILTAVGAVGAVHVTGAVVQQTNGANTVKVGESVTVAHTAAGTTTTTVPVEPAIAVPAPAPPA